MKKCNCPKCGKELTKIKSHSETVYSFYCDDCNLEIHLIDKKQEKELWEKLCAKIMIQPEGDKDE